MFAPTPAAALPQGSVLAFDFGMQRIGIAVGETLIGSARELTTISAPDNDTRFKAIAKLINEWQPVRLVVGLPLALDGTEHDMTARAKRFANQLHGRFGLTVDLVDERFSSVEAEDDLRRQGLDWKKRKPLLDAGAARIILQSYFENSLRADAKLPTP